MIINTNIYKELVLVLDTFNTTDIYAWIGIHKDDKHIADIQINRITKTIIGIDMIYPKIEHLHLLEPLLKNSSKIFNWIKEVI